MFYLTTIDEAIEWIGALEIPGGAEPEEEFVVIEEKPVIFVALHDPPITIDIFVTVGCEPQKITEFADRLKQFSLNELETFNWSESLREEILKRVNDLKPEEPQGELDKVPAGIKMLQ